MVDKSLRSLERDIRAIEQIPLLAHSEVEASLAAGTAYRVAHGLGRPFRGWVVTRQDADTKVYETNLSTTDRSRELWLKAASDVNITVMVF